MDIGVSVGRVVLGEFVFFVVCGVVLVMVLE